MTLYATSDWHIGHRLVAGHRGFTNTDDHDNTILGNLLAVLTKHDRLKVLGDVTASSGQLPKALELAATLPCPVDLISGNHDGATRCTGTPTGGNGGTWPGSRRCRRSPG